MEIPADSMLPTVGARFPRPIEIPSDSRPPAPVDQATE